MKARAFLQDGLIFVSKSGAFTASELGTTRLALVTNVRLSKKLAKFKRCRLFILNVNDKEKNVYNMTTGDRVIKNFSVTDEEAKKLVRLSLENPLQPSLKLARKA